MKSKSYRSKDNKYMKLIFKGEIATILFARVKNGPKSKPNKFIFCGELKAESYYSAGRIWSGRFEES